MVLIFLKKVPLGTIQIISCLVLCGTFWSTPRNPLGCQVKRLYFPQRVLLDEPFSVNVIKRTWAGVKRTSLDRCVAHLCISPAPSLSPHPHPSSRPTPQPQCATSINGPLNKRIKESRESLQSESVLFWVINSEAEKNSWWKISPTLWSRLGKFPSTSR